VDDGITWQRDTSTVPTTFVHSIVVSSNNNVFIACGNTVYRSTDDGLSWTNTGLNASVGVFCLALSPNDHVIAGTLGDAVFLSSDDGNVWVRDTTGLSDFMIRAVAVSSDGFLYAGTHSSGVFRSRGPLSP
jgi:photosystem II stability/assembly factor-like uncharacterized protein